jgi:hypothetical protein
VSTSDEMFPEKQRLWRGALLGSVIHAIMVTRYPDLANEQSWDGMNYNVQDSMGSRGTVSFAGAHVVGAFFDAKSPRNPFRTGDAYDLERLLQGMPSPLRQVAEEEALQYVLQKYQGQAVPIVTAVFWDEGERLAAAEPWPRVYENGAHLLRNQLLETEAALKAWRVAYDMSPEQVALALALFERKVKAPGEKFELEARQVELLKAWAQGDEELEASRESFEELGITF